MKKRPVTIADVQTAITRYGNHIGNAQFCDGHRAATDVHDDEKYQRSRDLWGNVDVAYENLIKVVRAYRRAGIKR